MQLGAAVAVRVSRRLTTPTADPLTVIVCVTVDSATAVTVVVLETSTVVMLVGKRQPLFSARLEQ